MHFRDELHAVHICDAHWCICRMDDTQSGTPARDATAQSFGQGSAQPTTPASAVPTAQPTAPEVQPPELPTAVAALSHRQPRGAVQAPDEDPEQPHSKRRRISTPVDWGDKFDPTQLRLLYLFSGKSKGHHSFEAQAQARGHLAECHDNTREPPTNLESDLEWAAIDQEIDNEGYDGLSASPHCRTFSKARARKQFNQGRKSQRPLRDATGPGRYGKSDQLPEGKKKARLDTLLALRAHAAAKKLIAMGKPVIIETPKRDPEHPGVFGLDEFEALAQQPGVQITSSVQCMDGALTTKPTDWLHFGCSLHAFHQ